jgi:L-iditol 2-dehydrogenase
MRIMKLTGIREMEMQEADPPKITAATDVLIKVTKVGVCGSDVHYYDTGRIGSQVVEYPFAVGHETAGTVVETGSAVKTLKAGDRVAIDPAMPCHECDQCTAGREHTCRNLRFLGCPGQAEGSLAEYIVMPEGSCFPLRDDTSYEMGVLSEPLAIGLYACRLAGNLKGASIGILGSGPIGMSVMLPAMEAGVSNVYVTDKIDDRLQIARQAGADWTGNIAHSDVVAEITDREPGLLDYVFECCGQQEAMDQAIEMLKPGGKLLLIGIPSVKRVEFYIDQMRRKEICIQNVRRQNECTQPAIDLIENKRIDAGFMVTHHFPFEQTKEAFDLVAEYKDGVMKAMIDFD